MPKYSISTYWCVGRAFEVEANSLEEAIESVEKEVDCPTDGEYIEESFAVQREYCEEVK